MSKGRAREREFVGEFIKKYNGSRPFKYEITDWPEDRTPGEVEAIAEAAGEKTLAIEHTIVETFKGRKLDDERFLRVFEPLEPEPGSTDKPVTQTSDCRSLLSSAPNSGFRLVLGSPAHSRRTKSFLSRPHLIKGVGRRRIAPRKMGCVLRFPP
jgi:hypothetical protein